MSHPTDPEVDDDMLPEYDFSKGVRGKHYRAYRAGTNVVLLEPDVAAAFNDSTSVNEALRLLMKVAKQSIPARRPNNRMQRTRPAQPTKPRR
jgi:hypothetical protein